MIELDHLNRSSNVLALCVLALLGRLLAVLIFRTRERFAPKLTPEPETAPRGSPRCSFPSSSQRYVSSLFERNTRPALDTISLKMCPS